MEALQRQHWSISIEAKANGVGFKLKLYRILHCSRLSFLLRIPRSRFSLNFKLRTTLSACERIGKSSSSRLFGRLCRWKSRSIAKKKDVLFVKRSKLGKPEWSAFRFPFQVRNSTLGIIHFLILNYLCVYLVMFGCEIYDQNWNFCIPLALYASFPNNLNLFISTFFFKLCTQLCSIICTSFIICIFSQYDGEWWFCIQYLWSCEINGYFHLIMIN